jgi:hypothetical protein
MKAVSIGSSKKTRLHVGRNAKTRDLLSLVQPHPKKCIYAVIVTSRYAQTFSDLNARLRDDEPFPFRFGHLLPQGGTIQRFKKLESTQQILRNAKEETTKISTKRREQSRRTYLIQAP